MNNRQFFRNAALVFGLLTAGSGFAAETAITTPVTPGPGSSYATEIRARMANMTPEQRTALREEMQAKVGKMTPEQREAFRNEVRSQMASMTPEQRETFRDQMRTERQERHEERKAMRTEHQNAMHDGVRPGDMPGAGGMRGR